ncbi:D-alanyl-D-alanine carboxypeptidase/D-alanyl-D-alanine-endopeptidase (penicillin-binding protein 4) [Streptomonospora salina]|uniref:D-alanyl-D-alanine carboxypeptidase/D-alanyl-D-alanine-endopeptidase (Penicillin-binding protein 4) n=1 Tax=Streptomonospora salina TaxID=104205 RepID=A0A841E6E5_9ACTN|nr:D-alanyl-D-alanine carboxypeptidase/D-alanyl-D-alanine-endopeptidase [Streptomonospora salina]MBB5998024.1 D-alanyl-D-alanine carboxypeptidase/D-alanyl-D-alanine-endopeptidase (penicillin-binding protein 4) [Streptomonospora salina]
MRQVRARALSALAVLNIFVLVAGVVAIDIIDSRPPAAMPYPVAFAEDAPDTAQQDAAQVDPERLRDKLDDPTAGSGVADGLYAYVADARTGERLYGRDAGHGAVPASTTKIVTGAAVLHAAGPDARLTTEVVRDGDGGIVLVGGGDPTLTVTRDQDRYPRPATLEQLAADTAAALEESGAGSVELSYDDSLYSGSDTGPGWKPGYVDGGNVATVHALMLDGGRLDPSDHYSDRVADPPGAAAEAFAERLEAAGVEVDGGPSPAEAPEDADAVAAVQSPPMSSLVEWMLLESANNIAEALFRQVGLAQGYDASFAGASEGVADVLDELGVEGVHVEDGSGLSVDNRIAPEALVALLRMSADAQRPDLYSLVAGLPTAHFTGTLDDRYSEAGGSRAGAGRVRAKTGTLNGVSALAGTVYDADGRLLVFAFIANHPAALGSDLDAFAAALAECGCR